MTKVSRNDIRIRDEKGPMWFNDFLHRLADIKPSSVQEILSAINNKRTETVESVVQNYRDQVGLDSLSSQEEDEISVKQASIRPKPLSIRHATDDKSIVQLIEDDQNLKAQIDSHCEHTGGTKNIEALVGFLRSILGNQVSFSDKDLIEYLEGRKKHFKKDSPEDNLIDVGRVGLDPNEKYDDEQADYIKYDGAK